MHIEQIHTGPGFLGATPGAGREAPHRAHVMLRLARRDMADVERALADLTELKALHQISGDYDLVAIVEASHAEALDALISRITRLGGVSAVMTSRLLAFPRHSSARPFAA